MNLLKPLPLLLFNRLRESILSLFNKINNYPLLSTLFLIFVFYLPLQSRYHKPIRNLYRASLGNLPSIPYSFENFLAFYLTDFLMIAMLFIAAKSLKSQWKTFFWNQSSKFLLLFLVLALLSALTSTYSNHFWVYYRYAQLLLPALLFFILTQQIDAKEIFPKVCWILFSLALFESMISFVQYVTQQGIGLSKLGEGHFNISCSAFFPSQDKSRWLLDKLFHVKAPCVHVLRSIGTFPHANVLGGFLGMCIFATYYLFIHQKGLWKKSLLFFSLLIQITALCMSFSRAALFGWFVCSIIWFGYFLWKKDIRVRSLLIGLFLIGAVCSLLFYRQLLDRGGIVNYTITSKNSDVARTKFQNLSFEMIKEHPIKGVGFGQFLLDAEHRYQHDASKDHMYLQTVHNIYLLIASETGLLTLVSFMLFIGSLFWYLLHRKMDAFSITVLTMFLFLLWIGCCDHYILTKQQGRMLFFTIASLIAASNRALQNQSSLSLREQSKTEVVC